MTREEAIHELQEDKRLYETEVCHAGDGSPDGRLLFLRRKEKTMTDIITYCDVIEDCRDCPIYAQTCDGRGEEECE